MEPSNVDKLAAKLKEMGYRLGGISRAPGTNPTGEEIAGELLKSLEAIQRGDFVECFLYDSEYLRQETGITDEEIEADPEEFKLRYREDFYRSSDPKSPFGVFHTLINLMIIDNGCGFKPTPDQRHRAIPFIKQLIAEGYFQDDPNDFESSFWHAAAPEFTDAPIYFRYLPAYKGLDKVLNEIFDNPL